MFDAKTHLSELIARAERGEEVIITRHNRPVAKLVPVGRQTRGGGQRRQSALQALQAFEPIAVEGASIAELISAGRR